jgi:hypothetical protein
LLSRIAAKNEHVVQTPRQSGRSPTLPILETGHERKNIAV